ncbi:hypothetical protein STRAU_1204 [Streptomyces aurantiacus JA 4570]|uniref:Uncharacterized protein n=1 Tax=Streptomyces aurantiacus JA 4570 TaxID=1286094 RepID=S3ZQM8_9ACTN|nr:hypothetical protein STRAU_1204 [Streptomyces aurantiacus JA 4570]
MGQAYAEFLEREDGAALVSRLGDEGDGGAFEVVAELLEGVEVGVRAEQPQARAADGGGEPAGSRSCAAAPASPVSANPEANATANFTFASDSSSITGSGSPTSSTARSTCSGRSATDAKQGLPKTVGRVGCTG